MDKMGTVVLFVLLAWLVSTAAMTITSGFSRFAHDTPASSSARLSGAPVVHRRSDVTE